MATSSSLRVFLIGLSVVISKVHHDLLLAFLDVKPLDSTEGIDDDLLLAVLLHDVGVDQVAHQLGSPGIVLSALLSILDSVPEVG